MLVTCLDEPMTCTSSFRQ